MAKKLSKGTKKLIINISVIVALTVITLVVLLLSYKELNFESIGAFLRAGNAWIFVAAVGCMLLTVFCEAISIFVISRRLGEKPKLHSSLAYASADVYYSAITPSATGGQPASAFYMVRDGMSAANAGFALVFNVMAFATSILLMGIFSFIARPSYFARLDWYTITLVIFGFVVQALLLGFALMCMLWSKAILKCGNGIISLLTKMRIVKKPEKWREKLSAEVEKYRANRGIIKKYPLLFFAALFFNLIERVSYNMITCLVCYSVAPDAASFLDLFAMQTFVLIGFSAIPLPGGVGAFEFMYINVFGMFYNDKAFIMSAMMVSRVITYYMRMVICGLYTLIYHAVGIKNKKIKPNETPDDYQPRSETEPLTDGGEPIEPSAENAAAQVEDGEVSPAPDNAASPTESETGDPVSSEPCGSDEQEKSPE